MAGPCEVCFLDGEWPALRDARISPLDRSFLFADGVYEVIPVFSGRPFRFPEHLQRLANSLTAIRMTDPFDRAGWRNLIRELLERNARTQGDSYVYIQVSRGAEWGRNHAPLPAVPPLVFAFCSPFPAPNEELMARGSACITAEDIRWNRCDIKSVSLLGNVLLRQQSIDVGAQETILLHEGMLREASACTVHVVRGGCVLTPPNSQHILPGMTRSVVEELADDLGIPRESRPVTEQELRSADEIWLASSTRNVTAVTQLDGQAVGRGVPGPVWEKMWQGFQDLQQRLATTPW
ncbi:MAG: D-amino acid aminotransferase [Steroidobacteraceae bacterium]|jgi:D-alanine transaminase|nr:D-amino acid aminotransferase [Gammaproteobacteria bacterium]